MIRHTIVYFIILICFCSCKSAFKNSSTKEKIVEPKQILKGQYKSLGENLFMDKSGNVFFRTIDRSSLNGDNKVYANYSNKLYYDTIIGKESTFKELEIKNIIDLKSFKQTNIQGLITYYKDKKHKYFHREMAYGGTLHCTK